MKQKGTMHSLKAKEKRGKKSQLAMTWKSISMNFYLLPPHHITLPHLTLDNFIGFNLPQLGSIFNFVYSMYEYFDWKRYRLGIILTTRISSVGFLIEKCPCKLKLSIKWVNEVALNNIFDNNNSKECKMLCNNIDIGYRPHWFGHN